MGIFASFVRKEFKHILRDPRTLLIIVMIPIVQVTLFGFALTNEVKHIDVALYAPRLNEPIRQLAAKIDANEYFSVTARLHTPDEIDEVLRTGKADIVLRIDQDIQRKTVSPDGTPALQFLVDASDPSTATAESNYLRAVVMDFMAQTAHTPGSNASAGIKTSVRMLYNPQRLSSYNFVPGIMGLIFILICAMMTSVSIVREKEIGSMEVLLVSPVRPLYIVFAKMIPYLAISCVNLVCILLLARYLLDVPMEGNLFMLAGISVLYIILALSLGLLISTVAQNQAMALILSFISLMFPCIMMAGIIFPIENMPAAFQGISVLLPARWYVEAVRKLMIEGVGAGYVVKETLILIGMTVFLLAVAIRKFKNTL
ncbi:ABC transporter permease [Phocaeicola sp.]